MSVVNENKDNLVIKKAVKDALADLNTIQTTTFNSVGALQVAVKREAEILEKLIRYLFRGE